MRVLFQCIWVEHDLKGQNKTIEKLSITFHSYLTKGLFNVDLNILKIYQNITKSIKVNSLFAITLFHLIFLLGNSFLT